MKYFLIGVFFLSCFFSSADLPAACVKKASNFKSHVKKVYIDANDLEISEKAIYVHLDDNVFQTNILRTDEQGFFVYEGDLVAARGSIDLPDKQWRCPYCYKWWPKGQRCQNPECPTNNW